MAETTDQPTAGQAMPAVPGSGGMPVPMNNNGGDVGPAGGQLAGGIMAGPQEPGPPLGGMPSPGPRNAMESDEARQLDIPFDVPTDPLSGEKCFY